MITAGEFDLAGIRQSLQDDGYTKYLYRGYELWESADDNDASAVLEEDGFLIRGGAEAVTDVLRAASRNAGLLWNDDDGELKQALDLAGEGLPTGTADWKAARAAGRRSGPFL